MKLGILLLAICTFAGCSNASREAPHATACKPIGARVNQVPVQGSIYGSVGTRVRIPLCPGIKMPLEFIGPGDTNYLALKRKASREMRELQFTGIGSGYIVKDGGTYVFIAITLENLRPTGQGSR